VPIFQFNSDGKKTMQPYAGLQFDHHETAALIQAMDLVWDAMAFAYAPNPNAKSEKEKLAKLVLEIAASGPRDPRTLCRLALGRLPPLQAHYVC